MAIDIHFSDYVRGVRTSAQGAIVLAARLDWAAPADITPDEKKALRLVKTRAQEVKEVLGDRDRLGPQRMRPLLIAFANDWSALYDALTAKSRLPSHVSNRGPEAAMLCMSLFPDGASFTQLEAETAWVEGQRRIERIHDEDLAPRIEALVGDGFIEAVKNSTGILGNALGTGKEKRNLPPSTALQEALGRFAKAVGAYGRVLAWQVDEENDASVQRFMSAVEPLDAHRAAQRGGTDATPSETDPSATDHGSTPAPVTANSNGSTPAPVTATSNGSTPAPVTATSNGTTPAPANAPHGLDAVA